ncbi:MAG: hypothetical protein COU69_00330 [Candidatus Pacebacteria bacterium CG10_big_fil_rev_8_21_14_0_10_56_10]|nr:MAG: hypothetical protein COU69_00330 [Candidatus Pacebacteria bacterium CG10_big_fil_rev_8_21_14_0_10_56_10]
MLILRSWLSSWQQFWQQFRQIWLASLSSAASYSRLARLRWTEALGFVVVSYLLLGLVAGARFAVVTAPSWSQFSLAVGQQFQQAFPESTTLSWDEGRLKTEPPAVIKVPFPLSAVPLVLEPVSRRLDSLAVIDTSRSDGLATASALVVLSADQILIKDQLGAQRSLGLDTVLGEQAWSVTSGSLGQAVNTWTAQVMMVTPVLRAGGVVVLPLLLLPFRLVTSLLDLVLAYVLVLLLSLGLSRREIIQLLLHVMVVAELVAQLTVWAFAPQLVRAGLPVFVVAFWLILSYVTLWWRFSMGGTTPKQK